MADKRQDILNFAKSLMGYTNYLMGAKHYNNGNNPNRPKKLDCSGFVVWCYKMAGMNVPDGTWYQWQNSVPVELKDLKVGDIGIMNEGGGGMTNHVGLYAGNGYWIHCNYSRNGVTLEQTKIFKYPRRFNIWNSVNEVKTPVVQKQNEVKKVENTNTNEPSKWAKPAWDKVKQLGLMDGQRPKDTVTREELACAIIRIMEKCGK